MSLPECVVLDGWTLTERAPGAPAPPDEPSWDELERQVKLLVHPRTPAAAVVERARGAALILTNKVVIDQAVIDALPTLRYVGVIATGTNVVDLEAARVRGILVTNAPGYATESVVAHVFGLILELELRVAAHARAVEQGHWSQAPDFSFRLGSMLELSERTLGLVGFGHIGQRVAEVGRAFGMRVLVATRSPNRHVAVSGVEFCSVDELFSRSDVISLHCPLTAETERLADARRIALMKPDAILINSGRGPLVDELALAEALERGQIRGAGLDVLSEEPPPAQHPLLRAPRCLVTPHVAWATTAARQRLMQIVTGNVAAYLAGKPKNRVV